MRSLSLIAAAAALALASVPARADVPEREVYLGLTGGATLPLRSWDLGANVIQNQFEATNSMQVGLRVGFQLTSQLAFEVGAQYLALQLLESRASPGFVYHGDVLYHFMKGDFSPFIIGGAGAYHSLENPLGSDVDYQLHLGLGLRAMATEWLAVRIELRDVVTDGFGDSNAIAGNNLELTFGVDLFPAKAAEPKDTDKDGIIDVNDKCIEVKGVPSAQGCPDADGDGITDADDACPNEPGAPETKGCPDRDGDGVIDREDKCPDVPGIKALSGCPDKDGDGITDAEDTCPDQAGPKHLGGCPDRDGDGLADKDDKCPDVKGFKKFKGCPDTDGDGITDAEDACPTEAGKKELKGCPDRDGDGVADKDDKCPDVRGLKEMEGCLPKEVEKFTGTIKGINFEYNKANLLPASSKVLDEAVGVLNKFASMRIKIEGHTDNKGNADFNKKLSTERAQSVMNYFLGKNIDASRLQSEGFGPDRPIADNKNEAGRAQNRRVEFNLIAQ
ncbi:MAG TPA: OmpA family protein [Myxococcales bacterium]|jgi:outer membrane protein OmpA-like peptidoglycan-associated protein